MANGTDIKDIVRAVEDATTFPVLTQHVGSHTGPGAGGLMPAGTTSFGPLVRNALHDVLQWKPSTTDVKGLKAALLVSFKAHETSGRTVYSHVPRSYIMQVQSDGGAVTGAQASIHTRAKAAVDQSLPLLEGLYPLNTDSDSEDLAAVRSTIELSLTGLVEELARPGGPRIQRVDTLFKLLLGLGPDDLPPALFNADEVGGQLGLLRDRLGLAIQRVNNAEEEKNLTNFLILADHVFTLWLSWRSLRDFFDREGNDVFLGPQLVLLSRSLRVLAESVHETYTALDSVFIGPAEREVIVLEFEKEAHMTLADLLEWVDTFAASEGPQLIQEAGKDGVIAFRSTLEQLNNLLVEAVEISRAPSSNPTRGFHSARVAVALDAVRLHVLAALNLTKPLSRLPQPEIKTISPDRILAVEGIQLRINGVNFDPGDDVELTLNAEVIEADAVHFVSPTTLFADFNLDFETVTPGDWTVVVRNSDGIESELPDALTIEETSIEIFNLTPREIEAGDQNVPVTITGMAFSDEVEVSFTGPEGSQGVTIASDLTLEGHSRLSFEVDVAENAELGDWTATVKNPDGQKDEATFKVVRKPDVEPILRIDSVEPASMKLNEHREGAQAVVIKGVGFEKGMSSNFGDKIRSRPTLFISPNELRVDVWVRPEAALGTRTIKVISNDRKRKASFDKFIVKPAAGTP